MQFVSHFVETVGGDFIALIVNEVDDNRPFSHRESLGDRLSSFTTSCSEESRLGSRLICRVTHMALAEGNGR